MSQLGWAATTTLAKGLPLAYADFVENNIDIS